MSDTEYRFTVRPLTEDEGGGYLIEFPDLPGCMSDGETIEEAIANGEDAKRCWIAAMTEPDQPIPPRFALIDHPRLRRADAGAFRPAFDYRAIQQRGGDRGEPYQPSPRAVGAGPGDLLCRRP
jgi:predicted RNase H-like HicB family nuclease